MITTDVKLEGASGSLSDYTVVAAFTAQFSVTTRDGQAAGTESRAVQVRCERDDSKSVFHLHVDAVLSGLIRFIVTHVNGAVVAVHDLPKESLDKLTTIKVPATTAPLVTANRDPDAGKNLKLTGAVIDTAGKVRVARVAVRIGVTPEKGGGDLTVLATTTDTHGNFSGDYPRGTWKEAWAEVAAAPGVRVPVALQADRSLPRRVLIPVAVETLPDEPAKCDCRDGVAVPRQPAADELVDAPESYSADKGGSCVSFTMPNRTIEEYLYTFIVRTTDPSIKGLELEDNSSGYLPSRVVNDLLGLGRPVADRPVVDKGSVAEASAAAPATSVVRATVNAPAVKPTIPTTTVPATTVPATTVPATKVPATKVPATTVPTTTVPTTTVPATTVPATTVPATTVPATTVPATTEPTTTVAVPHGPRVRLDVFRNLGSTPTAAAIAAAIDQSVVIDAVERANAASHRVATRAPLGPDNPLDWDAEPTFYQATTIALGHLVYFKQVWKADGFSLGDLLYSLPLAPAQKKQIAVIDWERRETASRSEELLASEQLAADLSRDRDILEVVNTTVEETMKGASAALTGGVAKSKGSSSASGGSSRVMGVSGGGGGAASGAIQDSNRALAVSALQQLHDRTVQAASGLRSQRSTVVQTVAQGESVRVETETVANYNHCHAMTMEYFEVLRHFRVDHEVAAVSECLFVPLLMSPFSEPKALRWRTTLQPRLLDRRLAPGFDAIDRRIHLYEGSDLPEHRYADEDIQSLEGELAMEFSWVRPADADNDGFLVAAWKGLEIFLLAKGGASAVFTAYLAKVVKEHRDRVFREQVVPLVIEGLVQKMKIQVGGAGLGIAIGAIGGSIGAQLVDAEMDATLISRPRAGVPLQVSLRMKGRLPKISRANVSTVRISIPGMNTDAAEARALIRTGSLRYRTVHREDFLFRNRHIDNDLAAGDAVRIDTPMNREELRDPREEDKEIARRLVAHLNENLEYYHRSLWLGMDAGRRFMLLDGVLAPGTHGRSVASVVENRIIAIVGNSLVMPVAPGFRFETRQSDADLLELYAPTKPFPPIRLSLPTRGVFAEAVMGDCNACEKIDDTRFWRWEESPIPGEPPAILPVSADSRATAAPDLAAKDFATPMINLQNAPSAPDPTGLGAALSVIGASNLFRDVTGLEGNQKNAAAAFAGALGGAAGASDAAAKAVERAADLQMQKQLSRDGDRILEKIETAHASGSIDDEQRRQHTADFFHGVTGAGRAKAPVSVQEFQEVMATSGESGVGGTFDPATGVFEVRPLPAPAEETPSTQTSTSAPAPTPTNLPDFVPVAVFGGPNFNYSATEDDHFRKAAREFHEAWGFTYKSVLTFAEFVEQLAKSPLVKTTPAGQRIRLVTHAGISLWMPMFKDWGDDGTTKECLQKLLISEAALVKFLIGGYTDLAALENGKEGWKEVAEALVPKDPTIAATFGISVTAAPTAEVLAFLEHRTLADRLDLPRFREDVRNALNTLLAGLFVTDKDKFIETNKIETPAGVEKYLDRQIATLKNASETLLKNSSVLKSPQRLALEGALREAGSPFRSTFPPLPELARIQMAGAAANGLKDGKFSANLGKARAKLKNSILDVRGCIIGSDIEYLRALRDVLQLAEVTGPDMFMEFLFEDVDQVTFKTAAELEALMVPPGNVPAPGQDPDLYPAMARWGLREFKADWEKAVEEGMEADVFFDNFFKHHRVLPVCQTGNSVDPGTRRLYYREGDAKARSKWLESLWDKKRKQQAEFEKGWSGKAYRKQSMPCLLNEIETFVCSEPEYREHIRSSK